MERGMIGLAKALLVAMLATGLSACAPTGRAGSTLGGAPELS